MISVKVVKMNDVNPKEYNIQVVEGTTVNDLLIDLDIYRNPGDYFSIIDGVIKQPHYILEEGDKIEIFPAMCGG
ncbi:MAG: MoaD/ThiS family protein [Bacillota bacterium]